MSGNLAAELQSLSKPRTGMQRIPFPLESYQAASVTLSDKRLVNCFAEQQPNDARTSVAIVPSPGLASTAYLFGQGPVVALNGDLNGLMYAVSGTHFYRAGRPFNAAQIVVQDLGLVGAPTGDDYSLNLMVTIAVGVNAAVVCVPPNAYTCSHTGALNQIGGNFPGARSVAYLDGYFIFTNDDISSQFFLSELLDAADYDALDFAYADGVPNIVRRAMVLRGDVWFMGDDGLEVWYDAGDADFPLRRRTGAVVPYGIGAIKSACVCDGSIFYLSINNSIMRTSGYTVARVSTHAIETLIASLVYGLLNAFTYMQGGHEFYVLAFTGRTLVYDCATKLWHDRSSSTDGSTAWLPLTAANAGSLILFGSSVSGMCFTPTVGLGKDNGVDIGRVMITPPIYASTNRAFMNRLEIEMELGGADPPHSLLVEWSDDGGRTFKPGRSLAVTGGRVVTTRLGSFRQRVFRLTQLGGYAAVYAIDADITSLLAGG